MELFKKAVDVLKNKYEEDPAFAGRVIIIVGLLLLFLFFASASEAKPIAALSEEGVTITLYDDKCPLTKKVTNLPYRATWKDKDKSFEGCAGSTAGGQIIVLFFDDNTVAVLPAGVFQRVSGV